LGGLGRRLTMAGVGLGLRGGRLLRLLSLGRWCGLLSGRARRGRGGLDAALGGAAAGVEHLGERLVDDGSLYHDGHLVIADAQALLRGLPRQRQLDGLLLGAVHLQVHAPHGPAAVAGAVLGHVQRERHGADVWPTNLSKSTSAA
jgi:hypothetical protein